MTGLTDRVEEYVALRRALGFKLDRHGRLLADFANFCARARRGSRHYRCRRRLGEASSRGEPDLDCPAPWGRAGLRPLAARPRPGEPRCHRQDCGPLHTAAPLPTSTHWRKWASLLAAARSEPHPLRAATFEAFIGLLAVTGMRGSEAMGLEGVKTSTSSGGCSWCATPSSARPVSSPCTPAPSPPSTAISIDATSCVRRRLTAALFVSGSGERLRTAPFNRCSVACCAAAGVGAGRSTSTPVA